MKMFLIINIFIFSAMAVFLNSQLPSDSYSRVKYPQISLHSFKINKTTVNKIEKKVSKSIVHVKTSLNFTPVINEKKTTAKKINKVKFITLNNKEQLKDVENKKKIVEEDKVVNKQKLINKKVASTKLNLSYKEIEEQKAIIKKELKKVAWLDYKIINTDYSIKEEILLAKKVELKDRISTQISATEKSRVNNKIDVISQKETADELVFFDYSEDGKVSVSEVVAESTSNDPLDQLAQAQKKSLTSIGLGISKKTKRQTVVGAKNKLSSQVKKAILINKIKHDASSSEELPRIAAQVSTESNPSSATRTSEQQDKRVGFFEDQLNDKSEKDYSCLDESLISRENFISEYRVSIDAIDYSKDKFEKVHDFDIRFQDDLDDISQDYGQGYIDLKYKLNTKMNTRRAVIMPRGHDYMITAFDLVFEGIKKQEISIPVFTKDSFQQIVESKEVTGLGAQVLIELDDTTEDVELDVNTKYEAKLFLDNSLKVVDRSAANYMYVLFVGVNVGNTVIYFKNIKGEVTSKIVSLVDKEVYYEPNFYAEVVNEVFELYQEEPLSKCKGILNINKDSISAWSFESQVTKESINRYSISRMIYPLGTRKYFELKHLEENIFVGRWSEEAVIVPSEDYASLVWNKFDIAQSECLIQLNFTKKPKSIYFNGMSKNGFMNIQSSFLDRDGAFYDEVNVETQRAFLVGEEQGAVNIKVEYIDGSNQFLQTFCSAESYLVEQL